ncbi:MAG: class II fumarate hydratase [Armatimonas sp.]
MRNERDSMGEMQVPDTALYGASTQRAVLNFPISDLRFPNSFIQALGTVKWASAQANMALGLLEREKGEAIARAALEVADGLLLDQFPVDLFQTGSGTSTNMNANEVIANRAIEFLGGTLGDKAVVHPNDDVNQCQSSNDVIPTCIHVAAYLELSEKLIPNLKELHAALQSKAQEFSGVLKAGRTHLQDATPITLGQEFSGYAAQIAYGIARLERCYDNLQELALGGTAVGTGINTHPEFAQTAIGFLNQKTSAEFRETPNHFEAQGARDTVVELSGQLKTVACSLMKIANDLRWLSAGPRCALGEIGLPETQPGSSIMPAKVNPVICESVMMVCTQVMGNDTCITIAGQHGNFELNVMLPVLAYNILQSIMLLTTTAHNFTEKCVRGITANEEKCLEYAEKSLATCTALAPVVGYDKAAQVAKTAYLEDKTVRQAAQDMQLLDDAELARVLDLEAMTKPGL